MLGISPKSPYVLLHYLCSFHSNLRKKVILFKTNTMDEACAYGQYLENIRLKKGQAYFFKMKEHHGESKEGKTKWKEGKGKNECKYHNNECNDYNIDGHTEEKYCNLHLDLNSKNFKKDRKKNNPLSIDLSNLVETRSNVDANIVFKYMQKEVNINILHHQ
jgi:hypothetical protein